MAKDVLMPLLSPSMTEGTLVRWVKKEGDEVKSGEVLAEVETDKATMDLEAFDSGVLRKILVKEGSKVPVNARIGLIGTRDEKIDEAALAQPASSSAAAPKVKEAPASSKPNSSSSPAPAATQAPAAATASNSSNNHRVKASPLARKVAAEAGADLRSVAGSGPGGRIVKRDVLGQRGSSGGSGWNLRSMGPIAQEGSNPLSTMRQVIARRLLESKTQIPHFYLAIEVDAAPLVELRATLNEEMATLPQPVKLSLNDFVLKAVAEAIRRVPGINASFEGESVRQYGNVDLAFAVALPDGLITPIVRGAQNKNLRQISDEAKQLAAKARDGKLKPEEFQGGTFTVSNLGMMGIDSFFAIVNPPQAGILAVGNVVKKPVVDENDQIRVGHRMEVTLSCDHRVVDGAIGAQFLKELRSLIEKPALLLI